MKLNPAHVDAFRKALAAGDPGAHGLVDVEIFPGATLFSKRSTLVCKFNTEAKKLIEQAGQEAARLIEGRLGLPVAWGVHDDAGHPLVLWVEYFPGGARYDSANFTVQA